MRNLGILKQVLMRQMKYQDVKIVAKVLHMYGFRPSSGALGEKLAWTFLHISFFLTIW